MPVSQEYLDYIIDQLRTLGTVTAKRMFGGAGLYHRGAFFGLVADDALYFKVNEVNRKDYLDAGSPPFKPFGSHAWDTTRCPRMSWRTRTSLHDGRGKPSRLRGRRLQRGARR